MPHSIFTPFGSPRFSRPPKDAIIPATPNAETAEPPAPTRYRYRRSPFYLKIEGLTGPRPVYDERGRLVEG
jgi:hypothetical protein